MLYTWVTEVVSAQKCFKYQISCAGPYILVEKLDKNMSGFLAHLSRRLMGELIVYQSLRCPSVRPSVRRPSSVVRPSTFSNIFSSETTGPIELKFHMETP